MKSGQLIADTIRGICLWMAFIDAMYPGEKKFLIMDDPFVNLDDKKLGFKAVAEKKDFALSGEVDDAQWAKFEDAPGLLREGSIAWQLVKMVAGDS